jgi:hypothetical protein
MKRYRKLWFLIATITLTIGACAQHHPTMLGMQKERTTEATDPLELSVEQMTHHTPEFTKGDTREHWSDSERALLQAEESRAVTVVGYIDSVEKEDDGDTHLWIGKRDAAGPDRFVAEVTPYFRHHHNAWRYVGFEKLKEKRIPVRITGWLLWDELHAEELQVSRSTLWEIHPITKLEENVNGTWVSVQ